MKRAILPTNPFLLVFFIDPAIKLPFLHFLIGGVRALISGSPPNTGKSVSSSLITSYKVTPDLFSLDYLNQQNTFYIFPHMAQKITPELFTL